MTLRCQELRCEFFLHVATPIRVFCSQLLLGIKFNKHLFNIHSIHENMTFFAQLWCTFRLLTKSTAKNSENIYIESRQDFIDAAAYLRHHVTGAANAKPSDLDM